MMRKKTKPRSALVERVQPSAANDSFSKVIASFARDPEVKYGGGRGFGSAALRVNGKIFALLSSRAAFVAKLPSARVAELVRRGQADYFDPGSGRLMKEWAEFRTSPETWIAFAREAREFVALRLG